ncbi:T-cell surface glycoprotein CD3 epsilon chain [Dipodomys spectabilis]|uniref:T-cell surface glycoprotein CD3 epsilon chain n=1 Tax=Dipodomys spectabilis TaxID=105255 RepID=UPI001C541A68|nr:T-cell surface glycoprotein CD3 epsilon chain [Dipodomys spectabilis]
MRWSISWSIVGLCLLAVGTWGQEDPEESELKEYEVSISGSRVTLTCPLDPESGSLKWEKNDVVLPDKEEQLVLPSFSEMDDSGYYVCYLSNSPKKQYLYLKAKVCDNCVEVDLMALVTIIIVDICVTLGLLMLVYYWSKNRKAKAKPVTRGAGAGGRPRGQNKERPPPVPNPDYEPIRKGQRDLYSGLNQRGI